MVYSIVNNWVVQHPDENPKIKTLDEVFQEVTKLADQNSEQTTEVNVRAGFIFKNGEEFGPIKFSAAVDYLKEHGWGRWFYHQQAKLAGWKNRDSVPFIVCHILAADEDYTWKVEQLNSATYSEIAKFYQLVAEKDAVILKRTACQVALI